MINGAIPSDISDFIHNRIQSVEQLDVLFLLAAEPAKTWTAETVSQELRSSASSVKRWLQNLKDQSLIAQDEAGSYFFKPEDPALHKLIDDLREVYRHHRVRIIEMIFNKPAFRLQSFADAFRWKEDDKDG